MKDKSFQNSIEKESTNCSDKYTDIKKNSIRQKDIVIADAFIL